MEFLMDHLLQIIVIVGFVIPLLGKIREAMTGKPPESKPVQRMPTFGGGPGERAGRKLTHSTESRNRASERETNPGRNDWQRDDRMPERRSWEVQPSEEGSSLEAPDNVLPVRERGTAKGEASLAKRPSSSGLSIPARTSAAASPYAISDPNADNQASMTESDIVRGVIWSEILGPPRAKRPYRR